MASGIPAEEGFAWPASRYDAMREVRGRVKELAELVARFNSLRLPGRSLQDDLRVITEVGCRAYSMYTQLSWCWLLLEDCLRAGCVKHASACSCFKCCAVAAAHHVLQVEIS